MVKKIFISLALLIFTTLQSQAFEDCIIISDAPLVDIRIENNKIIDVCPLVTVMNEKNILIVHPLSVGTTGFTVWKDYKKNLLFTVTVAEDKTIVSTSDEVKVYTLDEPPVVEPLILDEPPAVKAQHEFGGKN